MIFRRVLMIFFLSFIIASSFSFAHTENVFRDMDVIWSNIWSDYVDPFFNNADWHRLPDKYKPLILDTQNEEEAYEYLVQMVEELDDASTYLLPPISPMEQEPVETEYTGIGIAIGEAHVLNELTDKHQFSEDDIAILDVFPDTPAHDAGLLIGDIIVGVDEWDAKGATMEEISQRVRGPAGSEVLLIVEDPLGNEKEYLIKRRIVDLMPKVIRNTYAEDKVVHINIFGLVPTAVEIAQAYLPDEDQILLLDLRSASVGDLGSLTRVLSWLTESEDFGSFYSRQDRFDIERLSDVEAVKPQKLYILVNERTSGLPEILALVLSELENATLLGYQTRGGFSLTKRVILPSGWNIVFSVARYESPLGVGVHEIGIKPDILLEQVTLQQLREKDDPLLDKALEIIFTEAL